ncbi:Actin-binding FH2/DRF autoregulatory [Corchorus olitorius]|uniref:Formin-like protein n=1 Tax=Corchorus olitorius TaxID=93759 RepID=A0A1R3J7T3_9ROSI|nr:Actin-binding FH2/DRF autoregulatory [Corchorus olitorius]
MALFRKLFYKKPPDGLLEICERVYVFDCCFTIDAWQEENYKVYIKGIVSQLQDHLPDASFLVFNFREGETQSQMAEFLSDYDMTIMDYPRQYEGSPLLAMEVLHHFLRSCESWLSLGQNNYLLMHCERGAWLVLAFVLAALLLYRKQYSGEQKTLDMIYRQAPRELLQLLSPLNPMPSQLRYLQYVSRRNVTLEWPPLDRALTLDCVILRYIPDFDGDGGCRPIFRIYGQDPFLVADKTPKILYSTPKRSKLVRHYKQKECPLIKIDINCHIQGDVVFECINLHDDMEREVMIFRVVFNTAFIRSNILMLNRDEIDIMWDAKEQFPREFRAEILFSEMDAASSIISMDFPCFEDKEGLPIEAFAKVHEMFSHVDWLDPRADVAYNMLQQMSASNISDGDLNATLTLSPRLRRLSPRKLQEEKRFTVSPSSPRSPASMGMKTPSAILRKSSLDSDKSKEAKPQDSQTEPLNRSDVKRQENNQSTAEPLLYDSVSSVAAAAVNHSLAMSHREKAVETKSIFISPQRHLSAAVQPSPDSSATKAPPHVSPPPPLPAPLSSTSEPAKPSPASETGTNLQEKDESALPENALGQKASLPAITSKGSFPTSSSAAAVASTLPPPVTPPQNEDQAIRRSPPAAPTPSPTPPTKQNQTVKDLPLEFPSSLEGDLALKIATPAAPKPPTASPLKDIADGTITVMPAPLTPPPPPPAPGRAGSAVVPPPPMPHLKEISASKSIPPPPPPPMPPMNENSASKNVPPPPPPPMPPMNENLASKNVPPPPPPPMPPLKENSASISAPPPPPPPMPPLKENSASKSAPPPPPPPPAVSSSAPPPPPPPAPALSSQAPTAPSPPPPPFGKKTNAVGSTGSSAPAPPPLSSTNSKNKILSRTISSKSHQTKKLKPLHWLKLSRAVQGSLWAEAQKLGEASKPPEIDMSELENLFSAAAPSTDRGGKSSSRTARGPKAEKVQLIDHRRAYNCEIMLSKVKVPLPDLMSSVLALEESALDIDQVENLIKFCPTKEEMETLKGYTGDKEKLGKCELFFLELMKVPRVESKLRVFSFKMQFRSQIRNSVKLKRIMQTILSLGNALNQGTARGSAIGFRLDSLLKLTETRARNNRMTLMHYLCKVLADKLPDLLDFSKDVSNLEPASKIQLKYLAEEMQAISKGLEKVVQELSSSESDGPVSEKFRETLKEFLCFAEAEVRSLASLYSTVGRNVDALILYFGEDPARCPFEQVISTLLNFVRMFNKAHEENCKQLEQEAKKAAENEKPKMNVPQKESENLLQTSIESKQS